MENIFKIAATHTGRFHADDVFSAALLKIIYPDIKIIRVNSLSDDFKGIAFDLPGGKYDHHSKQAECRENGIPYASFGLLWREFGTGLVGKAAAAVFDRAFIQPLDIQDNFGGSNMLCRAITMFNLVWDSNADSDECFFKAVEMAKTILQNEIENMKSIKRAKSLVYNALKNQKDGIVVLSGGMPWKEILIPEKVYFVVYPSDRGGYNAQAVPKAEGSQECKKYFPEKWRGESSELKKISGIEGLTFCHNSGYLINAKSKEEAIEACKQALKQ
ncbi:MAG: MYG1 family protein [Clostridiales bacterium]|nr:MYG1 family protein [Clostridiales bacterium]